MDWWIDRLADWDLRVDLRGSIEGRSVPEGHFDCARSFKSPFGVSADFHEGRFDCAGSAKTHFARMWRDRKISKFLKNRRVHFDCARSYKSLFVVFFK